MDEGLTLREAQRKVDDWISQFDEGYWPPLSNLARLIEEVGELAREMNHLFGNKPKRADEPAQDLAIELADILFVLLAIANEQEIDLEEALGRVLESTACATQVAGLSLRPSSRTLSVFLHKSISSVVL